MPSDIFDEIPRVVFRLFARKNCAAKLFDK